VRWTQALPRPSAAHREAVAAVRAAVAGTGGRVAVVGAWVAGNGLASVVPDARAAAATLLRPPACPLPNPPPPSSAVAREFGTCTCRSRAKVTNSARGKA